MYAHARLLVVSITSIVALSGWCASARAGVTTRLYEGHFDLPIPADTSDSKGWMDDAVLEVPDHITISDLDVGVTLTHTCVFDLHLLLTGPSGTRIVLNAYDSIDDYFRASDYTGTIFDDEASSFIQDGTAPFSGRFRPYGSLAAFDDQDAYGLWHLEIYDMWYGDTGSLEAFSLAVTTQTIPAPSAIVLTLPGLGIVGCWGRRLRRRSLSGLFG